MSSTEAGFDTGIRCPNCEEATMLTTANGNRICPHCKHTEPHEPYTKTTKKEHYHG